MKLLLTKLDESMAYQRELDRKLTLLLAHESPFSSLRSTAEAVAAVVNPHQQNDFSNTSISCVGNGANNAYDGTKTNRSERKVNAYVEHRGRSKDQIQNQIPESTDDILPLQLPLYRMRDFENFERHLNEPAVFQKMVSSSKRDNCGFTHLLVSIVAFSKRGDGRSYLPRDLNWH